MMDLLERLLRACDAFYGDIRPPAPPPDDDAVVERLRKECRRLRVAFDRRRQALAIADIVVEDFVAYGPNSEVARLSRELEGLNDLRKAAEEIVNATAEPEPPINGTLAECLMSAVRHREQRFFEAVDGTLLAGMRDEARLVGIYLHRMKSKGIQHAIRRLAKLAKLAERPR